MTFRGNLAESLINIAEHGMNEVKMIRLSF